MNRLAIALALAATVGCNRSVRAPDLGKLYSRVAQEHHADRNPVILIPGILGSSLAQRGTGRVVWGAFTGDYANPKKADGARLVALPMGVGVPLEELRDDVVQNGALESLRIDLFGLPFGVSAYVNILMALGIGGYLDQSLGEKGGIDYGSDHYTCFQFAYDWRRDLSESAAELHAFILERAEDVRAENAKRGLGDEPVRFDVVAHSMGGLLLRYYLRHGTAPLGDEGPLPEIDWAGAAHVERAVLVGTPNAGSAKALLELCEGTKLGPFLPRYPAAVLGTMPAVYQLLPRPRHHFLVGDDGGSRVDALDPALWEANGWGLAAPDQERVLAALLPDVADAAERRRIGLDHQAKCLRRAQRFFEAMDRPASPPPGTELFLVVGDAEPTPRTIAIDARTRRARVAAEGEGDGTVLRTSALLDERASGAWRPVLVSPIDWRRVMFFFEDHLGLTKDPAFIDNLLYLLLEEPRTHAERPQGRVTP